MSVGSSLTKPQASATPMAVMIPIPTLPSGRCQKVRRGLAAEEVLLAVPMPMLSIGRPLPGGRSGSDERGDPGALGGELGLDGQVAGLEGGGVGVQGGARLAHRLLELGRAGLQRPDLFLLLRDLGAGLLDLRLGAA